MIKEKLLVTRLKKGLSQEELAELVCMSQSSYSRRENGLKKISDSEWILLAKKLDVAKEDIFEDDEQTITNANLKENIFLNHSDINHFPMLKYIFEYVWFLKTQNKELKEEIITLKKGQSI